MGCCGENIKVKEINKTCFNQCENKKDLLQSINVLSRNTKTNDYFLISKKTLKYPMSIFESNFLENSKNTKFLCNYNECLELANNDNKENEFIIIYGSINENMKNSDAHIEEKRVNIKFSNSDEEMKIEFPNGQTINFEENNNKAFKFVNNQGKNVKPNSETNNNNVNKYDKLSLSKTKELNNNNISIIKNKNNINDNNIQIDYIKHPNNSNINENNNNILTLNNNKNKNMDKQNKDVNNINLIPKNKLEDDNSIPQNIINNPQFNNKTDININNNLDDSNNKNNNINNNYNKNKVSNNISDNNSNNSILNLNNQNKDKNNISKSTLEGGFMEVTIENNENNEKYESNGNNKDFCKVTEKNSGNKDEIDKNKKDNNSNGDFMEVTIDNNGQNESIDNGDFCEISQDNKDNRDDVNTNNKIDNNEFNDSSGAFCEISKSNIDNKSEMDNNNNYIINNNNENNNNTNNDISGNLSNIVFSPYVDENNEKRNDNDINNINCFNNPPLISMVKINDNEYINITLQTLSNIAPLTNYFLSNKQQFLKIQKNSNEKKISKAYSDVIYNLWDKNNMKGSFKPVYFNEMIGEEEELILSSDTQTVTKNLIGFLYRKLHDELNEINRNNVFEDYNDSTQNDPKIEFNKSQKNFNLKNKSIITDIFYFSKANIVQCLKCGTLTYSYSMEYFISFPLEKVKQNKNKNNNFHNINILDCFAYYTRKTIIPENGINCKFCNKFEKYTVYARLSTLPEVLTIFLYKDKNKEFNGDFQINYILENLNFYMININNNTNNIRYELIGVVIERSSSGIDKTFFTYSKSPVDKKWYLYNDSNVKYIPEPNQEIRGIPFLLYYQKIKDNI